MRRILVVANKTLGGPPLLAEIERQMASDHCHLHLLVPATPASHGLIWTEQEAKVEAAHRLADGMERLRALGCDVSGEVGDQRPLDAIGDCLRERDYDLVIVSTLPANVSRWLKLDLPQRVVRLTPVPVVHVVSMLEAV